MIGFIAGVLGGLAIKAGNIADIDLSDSKLLLGLMAAGYAGTDFIENAFTNLFPQGGAQKGSGGAAARERTAAQPEKVDEQGSEASALSEKFDALSAKVEKVRAVLQGAAGDGIVPGTNYPIWALKRDAKVARALYWQYIVEGGQAHQLPLSVILSIGSKESQWGLALRPKGPAGTGDFTRRDPAKWGHAMPTDGLGWGRGLMQIDWYSNEFARTGNWRDARANILYGCSLLAEKIKKFTDAGQDQDTALRCGVSSYNGMSGAHSPYANDVMARAAWIREEGLDSSQAPVAEAA